MAQFTPEKFLDFVRNFREDNLDQKKALLAFARQAAKSNPELFTDEAEWVVEYRRNPKGNIYLKVPYFPQRDNYRDANRTCFSSSCAMLLEYLKPGTLPGSKGDDIYIKRVFTYGDTTDAHIQLQALKSFETKAKFITDGTFDLLDSQLDAGIAVPVGILHKGPSTNPSGSGHWIIITGKEIDSKAPGGCWYIVNDPWGEIDHETGAYVNTNGKQKRYSKKLLDSRWTVEGSNDGWAIIASK